MLEDCQQDGDLEGPDVRPHGHGQEVRNLFSVMRILWNGCKQ